MMKISERLGFVIIRSSNIVSASGDGTALTISADGTVISELTYTTYPLRVLAGQRMNGFGMIDFNTRYYDLLARVLYSGLHNYSAAGQSSGIVQGKTRGKS
jgi:hypothetical protein